MRLTVIMPMYNRQQYVRFALESLLRQRGACDLDILVIDDGSTDDSPARVRELADRYGRIRMITTENQGVTKARNVGLANIPGDAEFVSFLDSDDISPSDRFRSDLAAFQDQPALQFTYGQMTLVDGLNDEAFEPAPDARRVTVRGVSLSAGIYRAPYLRSLGAFDESLEQAEDMDFLFRAFESQAPYRLTDTICVYYRRHPGNMTRQTAVSLKCAMRVIHKSLVRRRGCPSLGSPAGVFDMKALMECRLD